jgi:hypothetical protein
LLRGDCRLEFARQELQYCLDNGHKREQDWHHRERDLHEENLR